MCALPDDRPQMGHKVGHRLEANLKGEVLGMLLIGVESDAETAGFPRLLYGQLRRKQRRLLSPASASSGRVLLRRPKQEHRSTDGGLRGLRPFPIFIAPPFFSSSHVVPVRHHRGGFSASGSTGRAHKSSEETCSATGLDTRAGRSGSTFLIASR